MTLHMFEPEEGKAASRTFDVAADGEIVLRDFNPAAAAGGALKAVSHEFPVTVSGDKWN